jgi:branched-subunit amino acid transport protein
MIFWLLVVFSTVTACLFRVVPFVFKDSALLNNTEGSIYRFLSYSTQAMMGVIIYDRAFNKVDALALIENFQSDDVLKLCVLALIFLIVVKTKKMLPALCSSLLIYLLAVACRNGGI